MPYFDHNATSPMLPQAREAWVQACEQFPGNPSSPHRVGARAEAALQDARERLAHVLGCDPFDLVWTSGATESNNLVFHHLRRTLRASEQVWVSSIEHPCVLEPARAWLGKRHRLIPVRPNGVIDLDWLADHLREDHRPALVSVMAANNETGVLQPWRKILKLCQDAGVHFFCDAVQWLGRLPAHGLGDCAFLSGCAHKFGGPRGVGFLKCPPGSRIRPLLLGGPQEDGRRAGTENVPGVLSMMAALELRQSVLGSSGSALADRLQWRSQFEAALVRALPGTEIVGAHAERLWNTVSAVMPQANQCFRWVVKLDKVGLFVSTGSACSSGQEKPSHVLAAMGYDADQAGRVLRFSSGWETTESQWDELLAGIRTLAGAVRTT